MAKLSEHTLTEKAEFVRQIKALFNEIDVSITEFSRLLEAESRIVVTPVKLTAWLRRGAAPKSAEERASLLAATERVVVAVKGGRELSDSDLDEARWVKGLDAKRQIRSWYKQGLSPKQVHIAGEITATQLATWESGAPARIDRLRFERFKLLVDHWLDVLKEQGSLTQCPGATVRAQLRTWQKQGLTAEEIRAAGEISPALFQQWQSGSPVPQVHFDRVKLMVDHWLQVKAAWQADPSRSSPARAIL